MARRAAIPFDETRAAIIDKAEALFRTVGYAKTTVADIATALAMSSANVYRFFASKAEINDAICRRVTGTIRADMLTARHAEGGAVERLTHVIETLNDRTRSLLTDEKRVFDMVEVAITEDWESVEAHIAAVHGIIADIIAEGIAEGVFSPGDPAALAVTVMDACCVLWHPTMVAECAGKEHHEIRSRRLVWFAVAALSNPARSAMP